MPGAAAPNSQGEGGGETIVNAKPTDLLPKTYG